MTQSFLSSCKLQLRPINWEFGSMTRLRTKSLCVRHPLNILKSSRHKTLWRMALLFVGLWALSYRISADRRNQINNTARLKDKTPSDQTWSQRNTASPKVRALRIYLSAERKDTNWSEDPLVVQVQSAKNFLLFSVSYDNKRGGFGSKGPSVKRGQTEQCNNVTFRNVTVRSQMTSVAAQFQEQRRAAWIPAFLKGEKKNIWL